MNPGGAALFAGRLPAARVSGTYGRSSWRRNPYDGAGHGRGPGPRPGVAGLPTGPHWAQLALPTGITAAFAGNTSATVQVHTDDAACFTASLDTVSKATATLFNAKAP